MATFGETIAARRKELGLSQRELAARIVKEDGVAISAQYLNDIEKDRRNAPPDHLIDQFAQALDMEADLLFATAGTIPPDIRQATTQSAQAVELFAAFRRTLKAEE